ncbi:unnamed protein product [Periconia digitata]|uniref:Uncharacterized protein n=1 Tax=Periconia digitata TaxID=1303443 RepID=A0A9W4XXM5_9PLEO|nr:unnamed protein product [Periconia digitata]
MHSRLEQNRRYKSEVVSPVALSTTTTMRFLTIVVLALPPLCVSQRWLPFDRPLPCMTRPVSLINAGDTLEFYLSNSRNSTCEMTIDYFDPAFLPYSVTVKPKNCAGDQMANYSIPCNSPNGLISVSWQCVGSQALSCSLLNITGGSEDYEQLQIEISEALPQVTCLRNISSLRTEPTVLTNGSGLIPDCAGDN